MKILADGLVVSMVPSAAIIGTVAIGARGALPEVVMPALVAGIHVFLLALVKSWMAATSAAMTGPFERHPRVSSPAMTVIWEVPG
jgi:hypothetical protein